MPLRLTCCGLSVLLSLMSIVALREPPLAGLKVIPMVHVPPAATLVPQGVAGDRAKSFGLVPVNMIELIVRVEFPVLVKTTFWAGLVVPVNLNPKFRSTGTSFTVPEETVIVTAADFVESLTDAAVKVIAPPAGTLPGAVYVVAAPLAVVDGETVPHLGEQAVVPWVNVHFAP